uniref:Leucine rich repeat containing 31 n=1 Tax=Amphilophus citrinellus TaxID=61819 RepID=A0A3Q0RJH2_AMPCI
LGKKADSRSLSLAHCDLTATDLLELGTLLQFLPQVEEMDVSWNELIGGCLAALTTHLRHVAGVRTLRLCSCRLNADDIAALGMVAALPRLCVLDVSCNDELTQEVDSGGFRELAASLSHATSLTSLRLQACGLTADSLDALGTNIYFFQVLPSLTTLMELDVSSNKEAGGVVHLLVSALPLMQMRRLPLNSCYLTAAVCRRGCLSSLRALDLSYNSSVGDDGWCALFAAGGLGSLEDVDVSLRPSASAPCSAWLPALLRALPQTPALARLAMQRWTAGSQERQQLSYCLRKRSVLLEWDPVSNQESPEESQPEE